MKRRGFLKALFAAPAIPYVPEAEPLKHVVSAFTGIFPKSTAKVVDAVDFYESNWGRDEEFSYQLAKKMRQIKRDLERNP